MENKCPKCGHVLSSTDNNEKIEFCPFCGANIKEEEKQIENAFCPHCGNKRTDSTNICSHCGKEIEKPKEEPKPYQAASKISEPNFPPLHSVSEPDVVSNGYAGGLYNSDGDSTAKKETKPAFENPTGEPVSPASPEDEMKPKTVNPLMVVNKQETSRNVFDIVNNAPKQPAQNPSYSNPAQQDIFRMVNQASQQPTYGSYAQPQQQSFNTPPAGYMNNYNSYPQNNYQQPSYGGYVPPQQPTYAPPPQYSRPVPEHRSYKENSYSGKSGSYDPLDDYRNYKNNKEPERHEAPARRSYGRKDGSMTGIWIMSAVLLVFVAVGIYYWFFLK